MLFLDLDGTLLDVRRRHYAVYASVLEEPAFRGKPIPEREYWGQRARGTAWRDLVKAAQLFPTKYAAYEKRFCAVLESSAFLELDEPRPGVETALGKLYTKTPLVLVTLRRDGVELENQIAQLGWSKYFETVLSGAPPAEENPRKRAMVRGRFKASLVRRRYRMPPTEAVWLGDTETDVHAAHELGYEAFLVEGGHRTKDAQMKANPERIVADLSAALRFLLPGGRWQR